jgi:hypothetical protein
MEGSALVMDRRRQRLRTALAAVIVVLVAGCEAISPHTISRNYSQREHLPVDPPRRPSGTYDDFVAGGRLFQQYCGSCHNARPLSERPFSNYHVALTHMRDQAYLTGKEYRQLIVFLRRMDNVGPPTPEVEPSPKKMVFSQPISELKGESSSAGPAPPPSGPGPWQRVSAGEGAAAGAQPPGASSIPPPRSPLPELPAPID